MAKYRIILKDEKLLTGLSTRERIKLAETTNKIEYLKELSESKSKGVREKLASNPNIPVDILIKLSKDRDKYVREKSR